MNIYEKILKKEARISLIGLGYVGLPIALEFARKASVIGFDIKPERIEMMKTGLTPATNSRRKHLKDVTFYILPTLMI